MPPFDAAKHPRSRLEFFFERGTDQHKCRDELIVALANLAKSRVWSIGAPVLVDEVDDDVQGDDLPIETLGGAMEIYSSYEDKLPVEVDRRQLEEVEWVIMALQDLSRRTGTTIEFEYDRDNVGQIEQGIVDSGLGEYFLGDWRKSLARAE